MPHFEHDRSKYLSQEEIDAMRLALRGQVVLKVVAMLEALGVDEPAIETAVQETRKNIAGMPLDTLRTLGSQAVGIVQLLNGEPLDAIESEEGTTPAVQQQSTEQIPVLEPAEPTNPVDMKQEATSEVQKPKIVRRMKPNGVVIQLNIDKRAPADIDRITEETVNANIGYMFAKFFSFEELKLIENLTPDQCEIFATELIRVYEFAVERNGAMEGYKERLMLLLEGLSNDEVRERLDIESVTTVRTMRHKIRSMLERDPVATRQVLSIVLPDREGVDELKQIEQLPIMGVRQAQELTQMMENISTIFGGILSEEEQSGISTLTPVQKDVLVAELVKAYEHEVHVPGHSAALSKRLRYMLDGMATRNIAKMLKDRTAHITRSKKAMNAIFMRFPDEVRQAYHTARQLEAEERTAEEQVILDLSMVDVPDDNDEPDVIKYADISSVTTFNKPPEQEEISIDRLIENTFLDLMHEFDFGYSEVKGLIDRLKGKSNQTDSGLVKANVAFLMAAREAGELLDEPESALLRSHFAPRPGRPPLSPSEIVELSAGTLDLDIDTVQRSIVGALAKLKGVRS